MAQDRVRFLPDGVAYLRGAPPGRWWLCRGAAELSLRRLSRSHDNHHSIATRFGAPKSPFPLVPATGGILLLRRSCATGRRLVRRSSCPPVKYAIYTTRILHTRI